MCIRDSLGTVPASRLQVTTDAGTAGEVTRAFLMKGEAEPIADVHDRHVPVDTGHVEALACLEQVECLAAVAGLRRVEPEPCEDVGEDVPHRAGVINDKRP